MRSTVCSCLSSLSLLCSGFSNLRGDFHDSVFKFNVKLQRKTGSVQSDLGQPTCCSGCRPWLLQLESLHTNTPALPHSSHFRPEANQRQIFVFILRRKTLNAALMLLLIHVWVYTLPPKNKSIQVMISATGSREDSSSLVFHKKWVSNLEHEPVIRQNPSGN